MKDVWAALSLAVAYPRDDARQTLARVADLPGLTGDAALALRRFAEAVADVPIPRLQEQYTAAFDFDPACALDLGWHLYGETRQRGAFLAALRDALQRVGVRESAELPDHLTHVLALLAAEDPDRGGRLAAQVEPAVSAIARALVDRGSPYAHVLAAVKAEVARLASRAPAGEVKSP